MQLISKVSSKHGLTDKDVSIHFKSWEDDIDAYKRLSIRISGKLDEADIEMLKSSSPDLIQREGSDICLYYGDTWKIHKKEVL